MSHETPIAEPIRLPGEPEEWPDPPDDSLVGTPPRRPGSIRRTANINMVWPEGRDGPMQMRGRARDLFSPIEGAPVVLDRAEMVVDVESPRTVRRIEVTPHRQGIEALVGAQGGSYFRGAIDSAIPGEREAATPLYFLLDDIAGCSLIGGFAWSQSADGGDFYQRRTQGVAGPAAEEPERSERIGFRKGRIICSGLRPGGYMDRSRAEGTPPGSGHFLRLAGDLSSDDPWAWHELEPPAEVCLRRRRRVDVWRDGESMFVDAHFRDSVWRPDRTELALHEYSIEVGLDAATHTIAAIQATPRVLPFPECPGAVPHVQQLVGKDVDSFRTSVQENLRELEACTHLNDMLRCLAEVAQLTDSLRTRT